VSRVPPGTPALARPTQQILRARSGPYVHERLATPSADAKSLRSPRGARSESNKDGESSGEGKKSEDGRIDALLVDLGSQLQRGGELAQRDERERNESGSQPHHRPTGIPDIDRLLGGGVPLGALCEISGQASSGRTSLALSLLARTTRAGELVGLVDAADAFDPISAERAGVVLDRVLWVRARTGLEALQSSERLILTEGFPLVVFDWSVQPGLQTGARPGRRTRAQRKRGTDTIPPAAWLRLTRLAAGTRTALLLLSSERLAGSQAQIALSMESAGAHFTGTPALLEELDTHALLVRHRKAPIDRTASISLGSLEPCVEAGDLKDKRKDKQGNPKPTPHESAA
jgi:recombination protein RecA